MKRLLRALFLLPFLFLVCQTPVHAATESIENFQVEIVAHQDGLMDITETLKYDFGTNEQHGIYREIPKVTKVGDLYRVMEINFTQILRDGQGEKYSITDNSDQISAKVGDPNKIVSGVHTYTISYLVKNGIGSNFADHDEIYWNVTGNDWKVPILSASVTLRTDFGVGDNNVACYTGTFGSKNKDCLILESFPEMIKTSSTLNPGEGLTAVWGFPVGTFPKSILQKNAPGASSQTLSKASPFVGFFLILGVVFFYLVLPLLILIWYLKNKRKERFGPPVPNFDFPEDEEGKRLIPAEAGTIDTAVLQRDDVVGTIFDLAIRKDLKIRQIEKKEKKLGVFGGSESDYLLEKIKEDDKLAPFEKTLMDRLFIEDDSMVILSSLKKDFYKTFQDMDREVFGSLVKRGYYTKNPKTQRGLLLAGTIMAAVTLNWFLAAVLFLFYKKLIGRTALGDRIDWKIDGLKLFLKNMSRNYKWQADQLYIVEKMIPYAIALGYIDKFMEQLKISYPDYKPDWYSGNLAFYAVSNSMLVSMNSGFTTSAPSSSSGFSGGGFSGGGGGGGGGGSW